MTSCTAVIHECTFEEGRENDAVRKGHSTSAMAGEFARKVCVCLKLAEWTVLKGFIGKDRSG